MAERSGRKRGYPLGQRDERFKRKNEGLMSQNRWAWVRTIVGQFVIWVDEKDDNPADLSITVIHPTKGAPVAWDLTSMTEEELVSMKHLFDTAFAWALPIVQRRDKEAQVAFEAGDDSHARIYRQVPQLVYRKRPESEHGEGVQHGSENVPAVGQDGDDSDEVGLRDPGDDMAERDPSSSLSQDDGSQADLTEGIRSLDGTSGPDGGVQSSDAGEADPSPST